MSTPTTDNATPSTSIPEIWESKEHLNKSPIVTNSGGTEVVQAEKVIGAHHYLLCIDLLDNASEAALQYTKDRLANAGDIVVLMTTLPLHGANVAHRLGLSEIYEPPVDYVEKTFERTKNAALDYLKAVAGKFAPGVEVHIRLAWGDAVAQILKAYEYHHCDLIILGRRKRNVVQRWLSPGSVSSAILTNSDCSLLIVR